MIAGTVEGKMKIILLDTGYLRTLMHRKLVYEKGFP